MKVKFGNLKSTYVLTKDLLNPSKKRDCKGEVLALICQKVGIELGKCDKWRSKYLCSQDLKSWITVHDRYKVKLPCQLLVKKRLLDTTEGEIPVRKSVRVLSPVTKQTKKSLLGKV